MSTTHNPAELDSEAVASIGKPYADCTAEEREAVEFRLLAGQIVAAMQSSGARTFGDLIDARRKENQK